MKLQTETWVGVIRTLIPVAVLFLVAACTGEPGPSTVAGPDVQATVQTEVANALASAPTATPWPTHTPYPTATPYPTHTPYPEPRSLPTNTPWPTHTPYPTATPYPTHTPFPTPLPASTLAPLPTYTPYPTPTGPAIIVQQAPPSPDAQEGKAGIVTLTALDETDRGASVLRNFILGVANCDRVEELIVELSQSEEDSLLKVYDMRVVVSNSDRVECSGNAKWSRSEDKAVVLFVESDDDDDVFYGYRFQSRGFD